ncbi:MAG TPA: hypothetical protein VNL95_06415 [Dehalococcoidia bacterium]|nr:hypothetical protein [Dehalococcoidia bacterium]
MRPDVLREQMRLAFRTFEEPYPTWRQAGRYFASQRRVVTGNCALCGREFRGTTRRRYCSATCRWRAARRRR